MQFKLAKRSKSEPHIFQLIGTDKLIERKHQPSAISYTLCKQELAIRKSIYDHKDIYEVQSQKKTKYYKKNRPIYKIDLRSLSFQPKRNKKIRVKHRFINRKKKTSEEVLKINNDFGVLKPFLLNRNIQDAQMSRVALLLSEKYQVLGQLSDHVNQIRRDLVDLSLKKKRLKASIAKTNLKAA